MIQQNRKKFKIMSLLKKKFGSIGSEFYLLIFFVFFFFNIIHFFYTNDINLYWPTFFLYFVSPNYFLLDTSFFVTYCEFVTFEILKMYTNRANFQCFRSHLK